jgi:hypothetical protein
MSDDAKEITGALYFSDHEPRIFGHLIIGNAHYEIAGIRRSDFKTDVTGRRVKRKTPIPQTQMDFFDENSSTSGERKRDSL